MTKLTLTYINRKERTSKTGKPFTSVSLKCKEYNDKFLSGFGNKENASWGVGQTVEVAEVREVSKDGKIYLNFEMPKYGGNSDVMKVLESIQNTLTQHGLMLAQIGKAIVPQPKDHYQELGINPNPPQPNFDPKPAIGDDRAVPPDDDLGLEHINPDEFKGL